MTASAPASTLSAIQEALDLLIEPGAVTELRAVKTKRATISGYFDDLDALARAALLVNQSDSVYIMPNPINPALLGRANNQVKPFVKDTTSDDDILHRRWLLSDYDPNRPTGISSTDAQHDQAIVRAYKVEQFLIAAGFPADSLVLIDSGNGAHLLARIDEPNDGPTRDLVASCLEAIKFHFADDEILVDTTVSNAARIWKLPGTLARKGDSLPDRPHRLARVLRAPTSIEVVPRDTLVRLAARVPSDQTQDPSTASTRGGAFDLAEWIRDHHLGITREGEWKGGRRWVLEHCLWNPEHTDHSAFIVQYPNGKIGAGCHHDHCQGKGWRDLRVMLEPDAYEPSRSSSIGASPQTAGVAAPGRAAIPWPDPLPERAFYGLIGDILRAIEPHSEADPAALLAHALSGISAMVDRRVYALAGDAQHPAKLNAVIVGETSKGRKGSASRPIERILERACELMLLEMGSDWPSGGNPVFDRPGPSPREGFTGTAIEGLSSGEGLIFQVRDPVYKMEKKGKGDNISYEEVLADPGVDDKRLWVVESEFASVLRVGERQGNTLSQIIRRAWDRHDLQTLVKNNPTRATGAHIAITGHVSRDEVLRYLNRTEIASGLANRFLWFASRRGRVLPRGGAVPDAAIDRLGGLLVPVVKWAQTPRVIERDDEAAAIWDDIYEPLSDGRPGLFGAVTSRSEAQVLRISVLYAILETSPVVRAEHLLAALAVWNYCEASARWVFGDATGDPTADTILTALRRNGPMFRTEISELFGRNLGKDRLDLALGLLITGGLATCARVDTGGIRQAEQWSAT